MAGKRKRIGELAGVFKIGQLLPLKNKNRTLLNGGGGWSAVKSDSFFLAGHCQEGFSWRCHDRKNPRRKPRVLNYFFLKVIPGTLIVIMCVYRLFALPPVLNTYVVIHLILIAIIVFFYTDIMLSTIYTFVKLRKQKREFFL